MPLELTGRPLVGRRGWGGRLPEWKEAPALGSAGPQPNSPFVPRKAWDVGGKEKYVIKYPAGYDPVTKTYSVPKVRAAMQPRTLTRGVG